MATQKKARRRPTWRDHYCPACGAVGRCSAAPRTEEARVDFEEALIRARDETLRPLLAKPEGRTPYDYQTAGLVRLMLGALGPHIRLPGER